MIGLRFAFRQLLKSPGFTFVAVLTLALGIGVNSAIFTVVNAVFLERLPYRDADRIAVIWERSVKRPSVSNVVGPSNFVRWKERATAFENMAAYAETRANLTEGGNPEELIAQNVTAEYFSVIGVGPILGRTFTAEESADPKASVVILSYELWQRRFGSDQSIVGRVIQLQGKSQTVIGVMPPGVRPYLKAGSLVNKPVDFWWPYVLGPEARNAQGRYLTVIGRLKPGVTMEAARTEMNAISASVSQELPEFDTGWGTKVVPLRAELSGEIRPALLLLSGAVAFVLLIACANVANLLLARGAARKHELAVRSALGATRGQIVKQLLTESLLLGIFGGAVSLLVAQWSLTLLEALSPIDLTTLGHLSLSYPVLAFTGAISVATALACGLVSALEGSRPDVQQALAQGGRQIGGGLRHRRMRHAFVIAEIALAVVLLIGAGLMLRSFAAMRQVDPGFDPTNVLTMRMQLPRAKYPDDPARIRFFRELTARVATLPGVQSVGAISYLPMAGLGAGTDFTIEGEPPPAPGQDKATAVTVCDNGFFRTLKVPLVRGRFFTEEEMMEKRNVVIVNDAFAQQYFPNQDPIGKRVTIDMLEKNVPTEIIGVVGNTHADDLATSTKPLCYWPHPQLAYSLMTLTVRTAGNPLGLAQPIEGQVHGMDKDQPVSEVRTMEQWVAKSLAQIRFSSFLLMAFAGLALVLAAVGIYGVMSYAVSQRRSEIGVRLAVGAEGKDILRMIVWDGGRLAIIGLTIGLVLAVALSRTINSLLFRTAAADPLTFAVVVTVLGAFALVASYLPARRAARVDPLLALRAQ
ncbi:MAG TPA: ABC transporter permease [Chthoniobacterales bacterium]|jgi:putative ABC transport system permease protein|nr:ABC transporter permease [Chthoniobacterales bacterium]